MKREREGIRPSVLLLAALLVFGSGVAVYEALSFDALDDDDRVAQVDDDRADRRRDGDRHRNRRDRSHGASASRVRHGSGDYVHHAWGEESELTQQLALHLPGPTFWRDAVERGVPRDDPQMMAMWRSFHGLAPEYGGEPPLPFEPTAHRAELVDATGDAANTVDSCDVRVLPVASGSFSCVVRVMCDGRVLYPDSRQNAGYVRCEIEDGQPVRAVDSGSTARDGDPLVDLDLQNGTVRVEEYDASGEPTFSATLRIQS